MTAENAAAAEPAPLGEIDVLRAQIDAIDASITRLIKERAELSVRIQAVRVSAGGTRIELGRERVILAHYRDALGHDGPNVGDAVLRVCRGGR
jgi:chorismate mutase